MWTMARPYSHQSPWITHNYCKRIKEVVQKVDEGFDSNFHFLDHDMSEDFYDNSNINTSPSEDIWKKFELIPTPPLSPRRDQEIVSIVGNGIVSPRSTTDKLQLVSEKLDDPISFTVISDSYFVAPIQQVSIPAANPSSLVSTSSLSCLISDCMWSGQSRDGNPNTTTISRSKSIVKIEKADLSSYATIGANNSVECVDPTAVFPFPMSDTRMERSRLELNADTEPETSDEEIDVVTVDQMRSILPITPRNPNSLLQRSLLHPTLHIRAGKVLTLKRKSMSLPTSPEPKEKRLKRENSLPELTRLVSPKKSASARPVVRHSVDQLPVSRVVASDCEDLFFDTVGEGIEKRTQHNVLERKRRNDLKYSFMLLRDVVPQLSQQERAAKVVILQTAVNCIRELQVEHTELNKLREQQIRKREQLEKKLANLQRDAYDQFEAFDAFEYEL